MDVIMCMKRKLVEQQQQTRVISDVDSLSEGDMIVVTDLARISQEVHRIYLNLLRQSKSKGASIKSLKDNWLDTTSDNPYSTFLLTVMAGVNQLERDLIRMRQREGIELAKERGVYKGRPKEVR